MDGLFVWRDAGDFLFEFLLVGREGLVWGNGLSASTG